MFLDRIHWVYSIFYLQGINQNLFILCAPFLHDLAEIYYINLYSIITNCKNHDGYLLS